MMKVITRRKQKRRLWQLYGKPGNGQPDIAQLC